MQGHPLRALHGAPRNVLKDHDGLESVNADFQGNVTLVYDDERTGRDALSRRCSAADSAKFAA